MLNEKLVKVVGFLGRKALAVAGGKMSNLERREDYRRNSSYSERRRNPFIERAAAEEEKPYGIVVETVTLNTDHWEPDALVGGSWTPLSDAVLDACAVDLTSSQDRSLFLLETFEDRFEATRMFESVTASKLMSLISRELGSAYLPVSLLMVPLDGDVTIFPPRQRVMFVHRDLHGNLSYRLGVDASETCAVYINWLKIPYGKVLPFMQELGSSTVISLEDLARKLDLPAEKDPSVLQEFSADKDEEDWLDTLPLETCAKFLEDSLVVGEPFITDGWGNASKKKSMVVRWNETDGELQLFWLA